VPRDTAAAQIKPDTAAKQAAAAKRPTPPKGKKEADKRCVMTIEMERAQSVKDPATGKSNTYGGGGVTAVCRAQDITITADSAEFYDPTGTYYLIGNVKYREPRVNIDARRMTYFLRDERLLAEENVYAILPSGTDMFGPRAEYFRAVPAIRKTSRIVAPGRPKFTLIQKDSLGRPNKPVTLVANTVVSEADSVFYAGGDVDIQRYDLRATADSAVVDNTKEFARLLRKPLIVSRGERSFTLSGKLIDMFSKNQQLERVLSSDSAHAVSGDLDLKADSIDLRLRENKLQQAYAWGPRRAHAVSPDRDISADSLFVVIPDQHIRELHAIRRAFAESAPDSAKTNSKERDWLAGDTIVATFDSIPASDTSSKPRIRDLLATGHAASHYQIPSNKGRTLPPSINYVRGDSITVAFGPQQLETVTVLGHATGVYLEPALDSTGKKKVTKPTVRQPARRPGRP